MRAAFSRVDHAPLGEFVKSVEGLRSLAVVAVIVFHINETWLPGGFLGVDLFFLISGFVVTKAILQDYDGFSFTRFWMRRFNRLFPAAAATLLISLLVFVTFAPALVTIDTLKSVLMANIAVVNFYFLGLNSYWDASIATNPALHYWSLSVEEQFYLIWPFLVVGAILLAGAARFFWLVLLTTVAFIGLAWYISQQSLDAAFFLMPARMFQFGLGATALFLVNRLVGRWVGDLSFLFGLFALVGLMLGIEGGDGNWMYQTLYPSVAGFLVLIGIRSRVANFFLDRSVPRYVGRLSYSLYLVHWPVIIFVQVKLGTNLAAVALMVAFTILLGIFLHTMVEAPLRLKGSSRSGTNAEIQSTDSKIESAAKRLTALGLVLTAVTVSGSALAVSTIIGPKLSRLAETVEGMKGTPDNSTAIVSNRRVPAQFDPMRHASYGELRDDCRYYFKRQTIDVIENWDFCKRGRVLVTGDSWASAAYMQTIAQIGAENVAFFQSTACPPILVENFHEDDRCNVSLPRRREMVSDDRYDTIVVSSFAFSLRAYRDDVEETFRLLQETGKRIVVVYSSRPRFELPLPTLVSANFEGRPISEVNVFEYVDIQRVYRERTVLEQWKEMFPTIYFYDVSEHLLGDNFMPAFTPDGEILYRDESHMTREAAIWLARDFPLPLVSDN